ncbi:MAG: hypothetical protein FWE10_08230 [Rikenellaceae bacterium]|nr:hypothetical protein [Rikenellaceae bacterium]MCL2693351.1 hypothetical protein [Rikenellaceae bacterium]
MMKKFFISTIFAFAAAGQLSAQGLVSYRARLAQPSTMGARVEVTETDSAAAAIRAAAVGNPNQMIEYFRVEIFFNTTPNARRLTYEAYARFRELFPDIPADERHDISYSSPKFTVRVGYFLTRDEAVAAVGRLRPVFETAVVHATRIELGRFAERAFPTATALE